MAGGLRTNSGALMQSLDKASTKTGAMASSNTRMAFALPSLSGPLATIHQSAARCNLEGKERQDATKW